MTRSDLPALGLAARRRLPRCGAKCRDGTRCQNPGTGAGGRCPKHGGLTPSGAAWHRVVLPADDRRYANKMKALARRRAKLEARLAAMSPEERERYEKSSRERQPGTPAERAVRRHDREMAKLLAQPKPAVAPDPVAAELAAQLAQVRADRARLEALLDDQDNTMKESNHDQ